MSFLLHYLALGACAGVLAGLRGMSDQALAAATSANALQAFPKLKGLLPC